MYDVQNNNILLRPTRKKKLLNYYTVTFRYPYILCGSSNREKCNYNLEEAFKRLWVDIIKIAPGRFFSAVHFCRFPLWNAYKIFLTCDLMYELFAFRSGRIAKRPTSADLRAFLTGSVRTIEEKRPTNGRGRCFCPTQTSRYKTNVFTRLLAVDPTCGMAQL